MKPTIAVLSIATCLLHCSGSDVASSNEELAIGKTFDHIAQARLFINGVRTLPYEETVPNKTYTQAVAGDLAPLGATYVSGLIRHNGPLKTPDDPVLTQEEIAAFTFMKSSLPGAKLDVVLSPVIGGEKAKANGLCPTTGITQPCQLTKDQILRVMAKIQNVIQPDIWFFDFFTDGDPVAVAAAIEFAHKTTYGGGKSKKAQLVGGHYFGNAANGTEQADFFAVVDDACGELGQSSDADSAQAHIDMLQNKFPNKPILVHINNNAQNEGPVTCRNGTTNPKTFACTWNNEIQSKRRDYIDNRHAQAKDRGFKFMYPVFFPACAHGDPTADPLKVYYDSAHDGLLQHIATKI